MKLPGNRKKVKRNMQQMINIQSSSRSPAGGIPLARSDPGSDAGGGWSQKYSAVPMNSRYHQSARSCTCQQVLHNKAGTDAEEKRAAQNRDRWNVFAASPPQALPGVKPPRMSLKDKALIGCVQSTAVVSTDYYRALPRDGIEPFGPEVIPKNVSSESESSIAFRNICSGDLCTIGLSMLQELE